MPAASRTEPVRQFPSPIPDDLLLVEKLSAVVATNDPIEPGTRYEGTTAGQRAKWSDAIFLGQRAIEGNDSDVLRIWASAPVRENLYNFVIGFSGESDSAPIFGRKYLVRRDDYIATKPAHLSLYSGVFRVRVTAGGEGYKSNFSVTATSGGGSGFAGLAIVNVDGEVEHIVVTNEGTGYTSAPTIVLSEGSGTGATATALVQATTCYLVEEKTVDAPGEWNSLYMVAQRTYETLPGPWIYGPRTLERGTIVVSPASDTRVFSERRHRRVLASTYPAGGALVVSDSVNGISTAVAEETQTRFVDENGTEVDPPIYSEERVDPTTGNSTFVTYRQRVGLTDTFPSLDTTYGTARILGGSAALTGLTVANPGSGYTSFPALTIGDGATGAVTSLKIVAATPSGGTGYHIGDSWAPTGGTFTGSPAGTILTGSINSITVNAAGSGYNVGDRIVLAGGTAVTAPATTLAYYSLVQGVSLTPGTGYTVGDVLSVTGSLAAIPDGSATRSAIYVDAVDGGGAVTAFHVSEAGTMADRVATASVTGGTGSGFLFTQMQWIRQAVAFPAYSDVASVQVASITLSTLAVAAIGTGYAIGDTITLAGGTFSSAGVATITALQLATTAASNRGTGYVIGEVITLAGGTFSVAATLTVTHLALRTLAINAGGTGHVIGDIITLVGGTGTAATVEVTGVSAGAITTVIVNTVGSYSGTIPTTFTQGATTGAGINATFQTPVWGVQNWSYSNRGNYTVSTASFTQASTTGVGTGATFNTALWGVKAFTFTAGTYTVGASPLTQGSTSGTGSGATFTAGFILGSVTVLDGGDYSAVPASFTQAATSGSGTGVTFYGTAGTPAGFTPTTLAITNGGVFTVVPGGASATTSANGTGMTATLSFGVNAAAVTLATYTGPYHAPTVTVSGGGGTGAVVTAVVTGLTWQAVTAYIVDAFRQDEEGTVFRNRVWITAPLPRPRKEFPAIGYDFPGSLTILSDGSYFPRPQAGLDYSMTAPRRATFLGRSTITYSWGPPPYMAPTFAMISPAAGSRFFPIGQNYVHAAFVWVAWNSDGVVTAYEGYAASTSYVAGQTIIVRVEARRWRGNLWEYIVTELNENGPLY